MKKQQMYIPRENPEVPGLWEIKMKGTLVEVLDKQHKNENKTKFKVAIVDVTYPNGVEATVQASIWNTSLELHEDAFQVGKPVALMVQIDPGGEYDGYAKMQLPGGVIDTAQFSEFIDYSVMGIDEDDDEDEDEDDAPKKKKKNKKKKVANEF